MTIVRRMALMVCVTAMGACVEQKTDRSTADPEAARPNILTEAPKPKRPLGADLDGRVTLLGCDIEPEVAAPGQVLTITTYWQVHQPVDGWRMFLHAGGAGMAQYSNHDHGPLGGKYPVSSWKPGEILRDIYKLTVPAHFAGPELNLYAGLWRGTERMKVKSGPQDGQNRVHLARLSVERGGAPVGSAGSVVRRYVARKVKKAPKIDGDLQDAAWQDAPETEAFVSTVNGQPAAQKTTAKLVYDNAFLYVAFRNQDSDVWSQLGKHDQKLWTEEVSEVMIDADGDGKTYIELQVNPTGATFDAYLPSYRQNQNDWESGMKAAVKVDGTLNRRDDQDKGWTVEIALPLGSVQGRAAGTPPPVHPGTTWRINLYRLDSPKGKTQVGTGWSAPLVPDFHALSKFGELVFGDEKGQVPAAGAFQPAQVTGTKPTGGNAGKSGGDRPSPRRRR